jgi:hypothetical protein
MSFDPYNELGVPRDASADDVKKAHRRKIKKAHPDAGGSSEEFDRVQRSYLVLSDPQRREHFDRTGQTETDSAALREARIVNELLSIISQIVDQEQIDLEHTDIMVSIRASIKNVIKQITVELATTKRKVARLDKLEKRLKPKAKKGRATEETGASLMMGLALRQQRAKLEVHLDMTEKADDLHQQMLGVFDAFVYEFEQRPMGVNPYDASQRRLQEDIMRHIFGTAT